MGLNTRQAQTSLWHLRKAGHSKDFPSRLELKQRPIRPGPVRDYRQTQWLAICHP
jgi:hypothetical protein